MQRGYNVKKESHPHVRIPTKRCFSLGVIFPLFRLNFFSPPVISSCTQAKKFRTRQNTINSLVQKSPCGRTYFQTTPSEPSVLYFIICYTLFHRALTMYNYIPFKNCLTKREQQLMIFYFLFLILDFFIHEFFIQQRWQMALMNCQICLILFPIRFHVFKLNHLITSSRIRGKKYFFALLCCCIL